MESACRLHVAFNCRGRRHAAKRDSCRRLSCETYDVLPAAVAEKPEILEAFSLRLLTGPNRTHKLGSGRPAEHMPCKLPSAVRMALATAPPTKADGKSTQWEWGDTSAEAETAADAAIDSALQPESGA